MALHNETGKTPNQSTTYTPSETVKTANEVPPPENGTINPPNNPDRLAPLTFITKGEGLYFFIIISDWTTNKLVQTLFLHSGHVVESKVPLGSFRIKYATGKVWRGEKLLFGDETEYFVAEKRFDFVRTGSKIIGHTIELIIQEGGNLSVKQTSKSEW